MGTKNAALTGRASFLLPIFYFNNFVGVNRKGSGKYTSCWINRMAGIRAFWGLDKIRNRGWKTSRLRRFRFLRS